MLSFDYVGTYNFELTSSIGSNFSWGGQATGDDDRNVEAFGENFPGAADPTINSAALTQGFESRSKIWNAGFFFQNVFDISDRYFITVGTRVDGNSAFGTGFGLQVYPKASASWIISDESFWPDLGEFKLRAAFGQSGRAPGAFDAVRTWNPAGLAGVPAFVPSNVGNDQVGPEVTEEIEAGFDASWLGDRLTTTFTAYRQTTNDALLNVPQIPSTGFTNSQLTNIGRLQNQGIELEVGMALLESANWGLDVGGSLSTNHSKVLELEGIVPTSSLRMDCGPNGDEGCPLRNRRDLSSRTRTKSRRPTTASTGSAPRARPSITTMPQLRAQPADHLHRRQHDGPGAGQHHALRQRRVQGRLLHEPGRVVHQPERPLASLLPLVRQPAEFDRDEAGYTPALWRARCNPREGEGYMWKGDFFKLRTVSATIPVDAVFPERVSNATFTLALRNSYLWRRRCRSWIPS